MRARSLSRGRARARGGRNGKVSLTRSGGGAPAPARRVYGTCRGRRATQPRTQELAEHAQTPRRGARAPCVRARARARQNTHTATWAHAPAAPAPAAAAGVRVLERLRPRRALMGTVSVGMSRARGMRCGCAGTRSAPVLALPGRCSNPIAARGVRGELPAPPGDGCRVGGALGCSDSDLVTEMRGRDARVGAVRAPRGHAHSLLNAQRNARMFVQTGRGCIFVPRATQGARARAVCTSRCGSTSYMGGKTNGGAGRPGSRAKSERVRTLSINKAIVPLHALSGERAVQ